MPLPTVVVQVDPSHPSPEILAEAAARILRGELVAFPTETVYGLGANAFDAEAVRRIFEAKQRPFDDPLIVHLAEIEEVEMVATEFSAVAARLASLFWPGPLTLLLPRHAALPVEVTSGLDTVAVRIPSHPVALGLLAACGVPIAAPSANRFGHTSPTSAAHVVEDLDGAVELILDGGPTPLGIESTVVDPRPTPAVILRPGGVTREQLEAAIGPVRYAEPGERRAASPGRLPRHYAPRAEVILCAGDSAEAIAASIDEHALRLIAGGRSAGVLAASEVHQELKSSLAHVFDLGGWDDLLGIARRLFLGMRTLEAAHVEVILCHLVPAHGLGLAVNDRLRRAAHPLQK
ncbi:MAG: threonylcarbamoyl-AMP synthase [Candidatus Eisenbacteria bacterium RBG_16_71_46]|nr:MAG: threonylcarbamoyl-AMP synthase [Candidatus Eisenbacteria bacterium RBG_16_71_46]